CYYNALNDHYVAMRDGDWKIMARLNIEGNILPSLSNIHEGNEKLVKSAVLEDHMLFLLSEDPSEIKEVSADHPDVFIRMQDLLQNQYTELLDNSHIWISK
ncbi:MAG: hypothetical protein KAT31_06385, partial [Bacteroidales bacterium]|nr:hypothetical protein [Bacteroidales bacterium]